MTTARPTQHQVALSPRSWVALVLTGVTAVFVLALALGGGAPQPVPAGLPDAGPLTGWLLELSRLASRVAAVGAVGCLLVAVLAPSEGRSLSTPALRAVRAGGAFSLVWGLSALAEYVLHVADLTGSALVPGATALTDRLVSTPEGITMLLVVTLALHVGAHAYAARTPATAALLLLGALAAVVPPVAVGHVQSSPDPALAASSMALHVVTAVVWVGGLAGLLLLRREPAALAVAARRFSTIALLCYAGLVLSGVLAALDRITAPGQLLTTAYGLLLLLKSLLAVGLGFVGGWHRSQTVAALGTHPSHSRPFLRLAAGELVVMGVAIALAVALASTPPPGGTSDLWRPDALVAFGALAAVGAYLLGTAVLDTGPWSGWRIIAFMSGVGLSAAALSVGQGSTSAALIQLVFLTGVCGPLIALGRPAELTRRALLASTGSAGLREVLAPPGRVLRRSPIGSAAVLLMPCVLTVGTASRPAHHVHLALCAASVLGGALLARALTDSTPRARTQLLLTACAALLLVAGLLERAEEPDAAVLALVVAVAGLVAVLLRSAWRRGAQVGPAPTQVVVTRG